LKKYINDIGFNSRAIFTKVVGDNGLTLPDGTEVYQIAMKIYLVKQQSLN